MPLNVVGAEGVPLKTHWTANKRVSLNTELLIKWADKCLFPSLRVGGLSAERPAISLYDGVQTHVTLAFIEHCVENNVRRSTLSIMRYVMKCVSSVARGVPGCSFLRMFRGRHHRVSRNVSALNFLEAGSSMN